MRDPWALAEHLIDCPQSEDKLFKTKIGWKVGLQMKES